MSELFEEAFKVVDQPEKDPPDKTPLRIRIHLFFDGTKNNSSNIAEREKSEMGQASKAYGEHGTGSDTSYDNGKTNIALMEPHAQDGKDQQGYDLIVKLYVEGQGTFDGEGDSTVGYAFGAMDSGVYQRARKGIREALLLIQDGLKKKPPKKHFIKQVDVDVFGFSRGAATARHAIHAMITEESMVVSGPQPGMAQRVVLTYPLDHRLRLLGYSETRADQINIKFAGLFDTVVSVNASQLAPAWLANNTRDQKAVGEAEFALHLAAADEHRQDFPLHTINSSLKAGKGAEFYLPGVHSDVGGSYNLANTELLDKNIRGASIWKVKAVGRENMLQEEMEALKAMGYQDEDLKINITKQGNMNRRTRTRLPGEGQLLVREEIEGLEYARPTDENKVINRGLVVDLQQDMENLIKDGWYTKDQIRVEPDYISSAIRTVLTMSSLNPRLKMAGRLIVNRSGIQTAYSNIPLKIMVRYAKKYKIQFKSKVIERADITLDLAKGLKDLEKDIDSYISAKGNTGSKPEDWLDIASAKKIHANICEVRNEHFHMSCRYKYPVLDPGYTPRIDKNNRRRRFYYQG